MRRFFIRRDEDIAGVSGTGVIAQGVVFTSGKVALSWLTQYKSIGVYDSLEDVIAIHCHKGLSSLLWLDDENEEILF